MIEEALLGRVQEIIAGVRRSGALIHCITNPISINDGANALLAVGARPIMAEHPREVAEITATAAALAVNLGNITDVRMESMQIAGQVAKAKGLPIIIDLVGTACSRLRLDYARHYIQEYRPAVIKGNISELRAVCGLPITSTGVEAAAKELVTRENAARYQEIFRAYAQAHQVTLLASGPVDMIADSQTCLLVENGTAALAAITGTGCVLNVLTAACLAYTAKNGLPDSEACLAGCLLLELAGEQAAESYQEYGPGTFHMKLFDRLQKLTAQDVAELARVVGL